MHEILHQIITSTAGQIGIVITSILSGKWIFEYLSAKLKLQREKTELQAVKIDNKKRKYMGLNDIINMLEKNMQELQASYDKLFQDNLKLKEKVYILSNKQVILEQKINHLERENVRKDKENAKTAKELKECLEKLKKS